jgi:hypothetical protein
MLLLKIFNYRKTIQANHHPPFLQHSSSSPPCPPCPVLPPTSLASTSPRRTSTCLSRRLPLTKKSDAHAELYHFFLEVHNRINIHTVYRMATYRIQYSLVPITVYGRKIQGNFKKYM